MVIIVIPNAFEEIYMVPEGGEQTYNFNLNDEFYGDRPIQFFLPYGKNLEYFSL